MAVVFTQQVPTSSSMSVPHGPSGVGAARRRMRTELVESGVTESVVDDAVLILSELLSNSCRHARPLEPSRYQAAADAWGSVRASWGWDAHGTLTVSVTDGGGATRPLPSTPSVTARGGRGLTIITSLSCDWGVHDADPSGAVTVWANLPAQGG